MEFAAVVLAGGASRRLGGPPKPGRPVGGRPMLLRVLDAVASAEPRIVVAPLHGLPPLPAGVRHTVESPPGGGPVAAAAAGLALLPAGTALVALLAADLPFLTADAVAELMVATHDADGAVLTDQDGRAQWLCGVWWLDSLARRLTELGDPAGTGMRQLVHGLRIAFPSPPASGTTDGPPAWFDCDTEADLRRAEEWADGGAR